MVDRVEWEVVETPSPRNGRRAAAQLLQTLLGRWWKWKVAGIATVLSVVLLVFATLAGIALLAVAAIGVMAVAMVRIARWLHPPSSSIASNSGITKAKRGPDTEIFRRH